LYDVRRDIINLNSELLFQGYYGFREIIVKEINKGALDVTEERKGSLKYNCITLLYQNLNVCIDRFNELHREIPFIDTLQHIFSEAYFNHRKFYSYYLPINIYRSLNNEALGILKSEIPISAHTLDSRLKKEMLQYGLIEIDGNLIVVPDKLKGFYGHL
jgi:hypothetical protein